jgi:hypothetical protein
MPPSTQSGSARPGAETWAGGIPRFAALPGGYAWRGLALSTGAHALVVVALIVGLSVLSQREGSSSPQSSAAMLVRPEPIERSRQRAPDSISRAFSSQPVIEREAETERTRVDMNSIQLSFADDIANRLPDVVREWNGALALADKEDPSFARYLISPPNWEVRSALLDMSGKVRLAMDPPGKWGLLRTVARRNSIALDRYQACALFDSAYARCLQAAIILRARELSNGMKVRVRSARLAFEPGRPCGVDVVEVTLVPVSNR